MSNDKKTKLYFYAPAELAEALQRQAESSGKTVPEIIVDSLCDKLGVHRISEADMADRIIEELKEYSKDKKAGSEFTLDVASKTYHNCDSAYRAAYGRRIALRISKNEVKNVQISRTPSGSVRRLRSGEALYKILDKEVGR